MRKPNAMRQFAAGQHPDIRKADRMLGIGTVQPRATIRAMATAWARVPVIRPMISELGA